MRLAAGSEEIANVNFVGDSIVAGTGAGTVSISDFMNNCFCGIVRQYVNDNYDNLEYGIVPSYQYDGSRLLHISFILLDGWYSAAKDS